MAKKFIDNCKDKSEIPYVIDSNYGVGVEFTNGNKFKTILKGKRIVYFDISSWIGLSPEAVHYYGKIHTYDLDLEVLKVSKNSHDKVGQVFSISGAFEKPESTKEIEIEIVRSITQRELKTEKFESYHEGDSTTRFNTEKELLELGKKIFRERFKGNWKLKIKN